MKTRMALRAFSIFAALSICALFCIAQTTPKDTSGSISGRVTIGGKGAPDVPVVATERQSPVENRTVAKATTDQEGNYRLSGLWAGQFKVTPIDKAFVSGTNGVYKQPVQTVTLGEKESVKNIDFALVRGGVITGRITDSDGRPIIGQHVNVSTGDTSDATQIINLMGLKNLTDDRGVYRVYGLSPGNYKVSVGQSSGGGLAAFSNGTVYTKTFYPGVTDESKATIIEINEGTEATNIDIAPTNPDQGFSVSGRVVDATSGQPVADVLIAFSQVAPQAGTSGVDATVYSPNTTAADGKFKLDDLQPGHYTAYTVSASRTSSSYSDKTPFDVVEGDVTGIEIKLHHGASVNGIAVIDNNTDPSVAAVLRTVTLFGYDQPNGTVAPSSNSVQLNSDGSFGFTGLAPGKLRIYLAGFPTPPKGLSLLRIERDGQEQKDGIDVAADAQITGVRVVFAFGTATIRGQVNVVGGTLPDGSSLLLSLSAAGGDNNQFNRNIDIDARGRFLCENVPPGMYLLTLRLMAPDRSMVPGFDPVTQTVTVVNGTEVPVVLAFNLAARKAGE